MSEEGSDATGTPELPADPPRVLIVVPTLGQRPDYLRQTLASVRTQGIPVAVSVVTPRSAVEAREIASGCSAMVLDDPGSMSAAVNLGMERAPAGVRYVNWLGDDDLLEPGSLRATTRLLDDRPDVVAAFGHCNYIDAEGRRLWVSRAGRLAPWLMTWGPDLVPQPGMLVRLDAWRRVGGLDESLRFAMDLDLLLRLRHEGPLVSVSRPLASFRWHAESLTVANRTASLVESDLVKLRHARRRSRLAIRALAGPVHAATRLAAARVSNNARALPGAAAPDRADTPDTPDTDGRAAGSVLSD